MKLKNRKHISPPTVVRNKMRGTFHNIFKVKLILHNLIMSYIALKSRFFLIQHVKRERGREETERHIDIHKNAEKT